MALPRTGVVTAERTTPSVFAPGAALASSSRWRSLARGEAVTSMKVMTTPAMKIVDAAVRQDADDVALLLSGR